jgi:hypothetical protein
MTKISNGRARKTLTSDPRSDLHGRDVGHCVRWSRWSAGLCVVQKVALQSRDFPIGVVGMHASQSQQLRLLTSWHSIGLHPNGRRRTGSHLAYGGESRKVGKASWTPVRRTRKERAWLRLITTKPDISLLPAPVRPKHQLLLPLHIYLLALYRRSTCSTTRRALSSRRAFYCSTLSLEPLLSTACFLPSSSCPAVNASAWLQVLLCALLSAPLLDTLLALPPL